MALFNRTQARTDHLMQTHGDEGSFLPASSIEQFVASLERPRRVIIMVKAGAPTDAVIDELVPHLEAGDIVVDGGNAHFEDTRRREAALRQHDLHFVGAGISGGEEGALKGPSIMPGGSRESYRRPGPLLENISAKVDGEPAAPTWAPTAPGTSSRWCTTASSTPTCSSSPRPTTCSAAPGSGTPAIADVFAEWNTGDLDSFLIETTAEVLRQVDAVTGAPLVDVIVDQAEQKGTGRWTVQVALELGVPVNAIAESVFARSTSGHVDLRSAAAGTLTGPDDRSVQDVDQLVDDVRAALWSSKVVAYAQGLDMIRQASLTYDWGIDVAEVAKIWRGGCIIRARLLERIRQAFSAGELTTLLVDPDVAKELGRSQDSWRRVVAGAATRGVPVPGFAAALSYYDTVRSERLPASLVQGLRDFFGAHTYRRVDREGAFHDWSGDRTESGG